MGDKQAPVLVLVPTVPFSAWCADSEWNENHPVAVYIASREFSGGDVPQRSSRDWNTPEIQLKLYGVEIKTGDKKRYAVLGDIRIDPEPELTFRHCWTECIEERERCYRNWGYSSNGGRIR